ncbi:hypothetical protein G3O08_10470 [Cryomorpha ignava]|uniref:Transcription elongation factor n=1 Tax=Cryomorpha ignava TaxID=101383 RepID=A0A7K3WSR9_9FLAO|nr:hypothetical protein [Cryomorpha ignava]NEN23922.1 hypothetical protein [Cryomorpha ignava]
MEKTKSKMTFKLHTIDAMLREKEENLEEFRSNQRNKLAQTSHDDIDNKSHESKTEETIHELDLLNKNVEVLEKEILQIRNIPKDLEMDHVQFGSLVETDKLTLLVGAAHDNMEVDGTTVTGISTSAPIYKEMQDLKSGDSFEMNGTKYSIKWIV